MLCSFGKTATLCVHVSIPNQKCSFEREMNRHTFKDAVESKRSSLANELDEDDDDNDNVKVMSRNIEGEEDESHIKVSICIM